ncbi:hypothetical protein [Moorena sp. SIO4G3]|nr:hypothetical protein [Moorena sp. SIO4G3]
MRGQRQPVRSKLGSAFKGVSPLNVLHPDSRLPTPINPGLSTSPN